VLLRNLTAGLGPPAAALAGEKAEKGLAEWDVEVGERRGFCIQRGGLPFVLKAFFVCIAVRRESKISR
jgi:hypothetical protein